MTVYFITDGKYVKIGKTNGDIKKRLSSLQVGNPRKLKILHSTDIATESELHDRFFASWVRGEWYRYNIDIHNWILRDKGELKLKGDDIRLQKIMEMSNQTLNYLKTKPL